MSKDMKKATSEICKEYWKEMEDGYKNNNSFTLY